MTLKMVITDFDGTFVGKDEKIPENNLNTLKQLGESQIVRVVATGRSLYSFLHRVPSDFPIDYLIFSSGAGIFHWGRKEIEYETHLSIEESQIILNYLVAKDYDFMIHHRIPDNHCFDYFKIPANNPDFISRLRFYEPFARKIDYLSYQCRECTQFLIVVSGNEEMIMSIQSDLSAFSVIRATSPFDHISHWIEIFPPHVSKSLSASLLAKQMGISAEETMAIGNDYNDIDLLEWSGSSYVVQDSPTYLTDRFKLTCSASEAGFAAAVLNEINHR